LQGCKPAARVRVGGRLSSYLTANLSERPSPAPFVKAVVGVAMRVLVLVGLAAVVGIAVLAAVVAVVVWMLTPDEIKSVGNDEEHQ